MSDIVDELRNGLKPMNIVNGGVMTVSSDAGIFERAAAEIEKQRSMAHQAFRCGMGHQEDAERLRAALHSIVKTGSGGNYCSGCAEFIDIARAALDRANT